MRTSRPAVSLVLLFGLIQLIAAVPVLGAPERANQHRVVKVARVGNLGKILVTPRGFALYRWTREKPGQIKCTGACAQAWPPLLLAKGLSAPKRVPGTSGKFDVVVRPDGKRQLTYGGHALYTFEGDTKPGEALCQAVEGWYVLPVK